MGNGGYIQDKCREGNHQKSEETAWQGEIYKFLIFKGVNIQNLKKSQCQNDSNTAQNLIKNWPTGLHRHVCKWRRQITIQYVENAACHIMDYTPRSQYHLISVHVAVTQTSKDYTCWEGGEKRQPWQATGGNAHLHNHCEVSSRAEYKTTQWSSDPTTGM